MQHLLLISLFLFIVPSLCLFYPIDKTNEWSFASWEVGLGEKSQYSTPMGFEGVTIKYGVESGFQWPDTMLYTLAVYTTDSYEELGVGFQVVSSRTSCQSLEWGDISAKTSETETNNWVGMNGLATATDSLAYICVIGYCRGDCDNVKLLAKYTEKIETCSAKKRSDASTTLVAGGGSSSAGKLSKRANDGLCQKTSDIGRCTIDDVYISTGSRVRMAVEPTEGYGTYDVVAFVGYESSLVLGAVEIYVADGLANCESEDGTSNGYQQYGSSAVNNQLELRASTGNIICVVFNVVSAVPGGMYKIGMFTSYDRYSDCTEAPTNYPTPYPTPYPTGAVSTPSPSASPTSPPPPTPYPTPSPPTDSGDGTSDDGDSDSDSSATTTSGGGSSSHTSSSSPSSSSSSSTMTIIVVLIILLLLLIVIIAGVMFYLNAKQQRARRIAESSSSARRSSRPMRRTASSMAVRGHAATGSRRSYNQQGGGGAGASMRTSAHPLYQAAPTSTNIYTPASIGAAQHAAGANYYSTANQYVPANVNNDASNMSNMTLASNYYAVADISRGAGVSGVGGGGGGGYGNATTYATVLPRTAPTATATSIYQYRQ